MVHIDSKLLLQINTLRLSQVPSFKNLVNCFDKMFHAFGGDHFHHTTIFINGIWCHAICKHLQRCYVFLDGRKAQVSTRILSLHKIRIVSIHNIQNFVKKFMFHLVSLMKNRSHRQVTKKNNLSKFVTCLDVVNNQNLFNI